MSLALPLALSLLAQAPAGFEQSVEYRIDARLNDHEHFLDGRSTIRYRNNSPATLAEIYLHLTANRYRDGTSTAASEQGFYHDETIRNIAAADRGYIDVLELRVDGEPAPFQVLDTLLKVRLARPLEPGAEAVLDLEWFLRIRAFLGGGGHRGRDYQIENWYPRVAVYDERGWHAEPSHDLGGAYAELAAFDVSLTLPRDLVVAATGTAVEGDTGLATAATVAGPGGGPATDIGGSGRKRVRFRADRVPDFAWIAGPDLVAEEAALGAVAVTVVYRAGEAERWRGRALERARRGLAWLEARVGRYPWPRLTVAQGLGSPGGAYPMLVTADTSDEAVLIGLLARVYASCILVSDGVRAAWLGEGLAAWLAREHQTERHGPTGLNPEDLGTYESRLARAPARDRVQRRALATARYNMDEPVATVSHRFRDRVNYLPAVRDKASMFLDMLRFRLGPERFDAALRAYFEERQLTHVREADLRAALEQAAGVDLGELFHGWLRTTERSDYELGRVRVRPSGDGFRVTVPVRRHGELVTPVDLWLRLPGGDERRLRWSGVERETTLALDVPARPLEVMLDPDAVALDLDRFDNRAGASAEVRFARPFQDDVPRDDYVIAWRPSLWYNEVDGVRLGAVIEAAQEGDRHRLKVAPSLGTKNGIFDILGSYTTPIAQLGRTNLEALVHKTEGRVLYRGRIAANLSSRWERRPQSRIEAGLSILQVNDLDYTRPDRYDEGRVNQLWLRYDGAYAVPGWEGEAFARYQFSGRQLDSDFAFNRVSAAIRLRRTRGTVGFVGRGFLGLSSDGDVLPRQERFYLGGAGPMAELENPGLRSRDSVLTYLNYHLPGDGNIRALNASSDSARRLFTINLEASRPILPSGRGRAFTAAVGRPVLALFGDLGKAEGTAAPQLSEGLVALGFGARLEREIQGRRFILRFDMPFYINRPGLSEDGTAEDRAEPRWVLSLSPAL